MYSIVEQPFKIPFIAAVMVEVNSSKPDFVKTALDKSGMMLQEYLETGQWRLCKLVLRFFACIQSVLDSEGLFDMLDELFNRAVDLQAASSRDVSWLIGANWLSPADPIPAGSWVRISQNHHANIALRHCVFRRMRRKGGETFGEDRTNC